MHVKEFFTLVRIVCLWVLVVMSLWIIGMLTPSIQDTMIYIIGGLAGIPFVGILIYGLVKG